MLSMLKNKISRDGSLSGTSSELTNIIRYCKYSADPNQPEPYMMTMSRTPDCYVKEGLCPVATFEAMSIEDKTLDIGHFALDISRQGEGKAEPLLRGFAQLVAEQTPEIGQITFSLYRFAQGDIEKLAAARSALLKMIGAGEVCSLRPEPNIICVSARWNKAQWSK